jgi:hypothetical protein
VGFLLLNFRGELFFAYTNGQILFFAGEGRLLEQRFGYWLIYRGYGRVTRFSSPY